MGRWIPSSQRCGRAPQHETAAALSRNLGANRRVSPVFLTVLSTVTARLT
jgi:hypothetical protein